MCDYTDILKIYTDRTANDSESVYLRIINKEKADLSSTREMLEGKNYYLVLSDYRPFTVNGKFTFPRFDLHRDPAISIFRSRDAMNRLTSPSSCNRTF